MLRHTSLTQWSVIQIIYVVMINNGNIRNKRKIAEKLKGCTYNTTQILAFNYPRAANLVPYKQHYLGFGVLPNLKTKINSRRDNV